MPAAKEPPPGIAALNLENVVYTFDEHMWDKLPEIQQHSQQGTKLLQEFSLLCKGYNKALKVFGADTKKVMDTFMSSL